jgi:hypothetical protein
VDEPLAADHRRKLRLQDLQRHLAVVLDILREIDCRHPAFAESAFDLVAVAQGSRESGRDLRT